MPKVNAPIYSLNGGEVGDEALARLDLDRMRFAGSLYSNVLPRVIGSMTMRPGLEYVEGADFGDVELIEFNAANDTEYLPVFSNGALRIQKSGQYISRAAVTTTIQSGDFSSFTGWTDTSTGSASAVVSGGILRLRGAAFRRAEASQTISVTDLSTEHGLRIKVNRGPVTVAIGSTSGDDDILQTSTMDDGDHSLTFTPETGTIYLRLWTDLDRLALVDSCVIDSAGDLILEAPYATSELPYIRYRQSIDTVFVANRLYQQREIIRWSENGFGIQRYKVDDGPFIRYDGEISLTPDVFTGNGSLTSSLPYFEPTMVGRLIRLVQTGQIVNVTFDGDDQQGSSIRISGVGTARKFSYSVSGSFNATWSLQIAPDDGTGNPGTWTTIRDGSGTTNSNYTDSENNVIKFARFIIASGDHTSGDVHTTIDYDGGSQDGTCRITGYISSTEVGIEVLDRLFSTGSTNDWDYSAWSDLDGWPSTVEQFGGRLFWGRVDNAYGSISDAYKSFDDTTEGESAPILRSFNSGGQVGVRWLLGIQRLLAGTDVSEVSVRSSAFDEPLTAANWFPLDASTQGCFDLRAVKSDKDGIYIAADGISVHRLSINDVSQDYGSTDLTELHQEIFGGSKAVSIALQRKPDTVIWIILEDGSARALTYEPEENVVAWSRVETDGLFKRVAVVKGSDQDAAFFVVERNGVQLLEKMAKLSMCRQSGENCLADSFVRFDGSPQTTFSVPHLDGRDVTVWADGQFLHDQSNLYTVSSGQVVLGAQYSKVTIGLPYSAKYRSTKLAYGAALGTALFQPKRVSKLGLYFVNTVLDGVRVGRDENNLFQFTTTKKDRALVAGDFQNSFDAPLSNIDSDWDTDSRVYVEMKSPYPCTVAALAMQVKTNDIG